MKVTIRGNEYELEQFECNKQEKFPFYINITNACNAKCKFCSNGKNKDLGKLDLDELKSIIDEAKPYIRRFAISGGEPLINEDDLKNLLDLLDGYGIKITLNTNGTYLLDRLDLLNKYNNIESVHLSRHHYEDDLNNKLFGKEVISFDDMKKVNLKPFYNINCLLIKGYIDSLDEVVNFMEKMSELDVHKVGFVSMMKVNKFAKDNFVDFNEFKVRENESFLPLINFKDGNRCTCHNYYYYAKNGKKILVFFRYTEEYGYSKRSLFYDCKGLKEGY